MVKEMLLSELLIYDMFRKKTPIGKLDEQPTVHPAQEKEPLSPWPGGVNPHTGRQQLVVLRQGP